MCFQIFHWNKEISNCETEVARRHRFEKQSKQFISSILLSHTKTTIFLNLPSIYESNL